MQATASESSLIGFLLEDRYHVIREIGRGGMGVVYEAEHVQLGKRVAIKLMLEKYAGDKEAVVRFQREALAASRIGNPHIIDVSHIGVAPDGRSFVAMELLSGQPLSQLVATAGALVPARAVNIMRQVLRAVGAAHAKGIVHRDLKPDNIFLLDHGDGDFVKLLDFGISKVMDGDAAIAATKLTTTGVVMGTPLYMAPEQALGSPVDHHADLYACGVILYEMLCGRPPFEGPTYAALIAKMLTEPPTDPRAFQPHLPMKLVTATLCALEKEPERRFANADMFIAALPALDRSPSSAELAGTVGVGMSQSQAAVAVATPYNASGPLGAMHGTAPPMAGGTSRPWLWVILGLGLAAGAAAAFLAIRGPGSGTGEAAAAGPTTTQAPVAAAPASSTAPAGSAAAAAPAPAVPPPPPPPGRLELKSTPDGAAVTIDHVSAGHTRLDVVLTPGMHHIHVELPGYAPIDEDENVEAGTKDTVVFPMQRQQASGARPLAPIIQHTKFPAATAPASTAIPPPPPPVQVTVPPPIKTPPTDSGDTHQSKPSPYEAKPNPY